MIVTIIFFYLLWCAVVREQKTRERERRTPNCCCSTKLLLLLFNNNNVEQIKVKKKILFLLNAHHSLSLSLRLYTEHCQKKKVDTRSSCTVHFNCKKLQICFSLSIQQQRRRRRQFLLIDLFFSFLFFCVAFSFIRAKKPKKKNSREKSWLALSSSIYGQALVCMQPVVLYLQLFVVTVVVCFWISNKVIDVFLFFSFFIFILLQKNIIIHIESERGERERARAMTRF